MYKKPPQMRRLFFVRFHIFALETFLEFSIFPKKKPPEKSIQRAVNLW